MARRIFAAEAALPGGVLFFRRAGPVLVVALLAATALLSLSQCVKNTGCRNTRLVKVPLLPPHSSPQWWARARHIPKADTHGAAAAQPARHVPPAAALWSLPVLAMAEEALRRLEASPPTCLPAVCSRAPGFRPADGSGGTRKLAVVSVPGSGNTWVRGLLRDGTRLYTGSKYRDGSLNASGFRGEMMGSKNHRTAAVKSHSSHHASDNWAGGALHIVRSPFDALTAECNRMYSAGHTGSASVATMRRRCTTVVWRHLGRVDKMYKSWEGTPRSPLADWAAGGLRMHLIPTHAGRGPGMPVGTLFYEDLSRDFVRNAALVLAYVRLFFANDTALPPVHEALICVLHAAQVRAEELALTRRNSTVHRQQHVTSVELQLFTDAYAADGLSNLGRAVCHHAERGGYWNVHKWGPCDGRFQFEREDVGPAVLRPVVPSNVCP